MTKIVPVKTPEPNVPVTYSYTALTADTVAEIPCGFKDEHTQLHFLGGTADATVTLKAGNAYAAVNDEVFELKSGAYMALTIDSSRFKSVSGENAGSMHIVASAACSVAVVEARI